MGVFASRTTSSFSSSATPHSNENPAAVGEVLNGKYVVKTVEEDENGWPQYKCITLHDHKEVLVRCVGRKTKAEDAPLALLSSDKPRVVVPTSFDESSCLDRFEMQFGKDTLIFVVQRLNASRANSGGKHPRNEHDHKSRDSDIENPKPVPEYEQKPAPSGSRIRVYKRGNGSLEVDIPFYGAGRDSVCMILLSAMWLSLVFFGTVAALVITIITRNPMELLMVFGSVPFWVLGVFLVRSTVRSNFTHENLTISPKNFRIRRTVELCRRDRDSVCRAVGTEAPLTRMDRIFCQQLQGMTRDLNVMTGEVSDSNGNYKWEYFVLLEGQKEHVPWKSQKEHRLYCRLSYAERYWLLSEIDGMLDEIKGKKRVIKKKKACC